MGPGRWHQRWSGVRIQLVAYCEIFYIPLGKLSKPKFYFILRWGSKESSLFGEATGQLFPHPILFFFSNIRCNLLLKSNSSFLFCIFYFWQSNREELHTSFLLIMFLSLSRVKSIVCLDTLRYAVLSCQEISWVSKKRVSLGQAGGLWKLLTRSLCMCWLCWVFVAQMFSPSAANARQEKYLLSP